MLRDRQKTCQRTLRGKNKVNGQGDCPFQGGYALPSGKAAHLRFSVKISDDKREEKGGVIRSLFGYDDAQEAQRLVAFDDELMQVIA